MQLCSRNQASLHGAWSLIEGSEDKALGWVMDEQPIKHNKGVYT